MKIISTPAVAEWQYKVTCRNCDSVLEVEASDLKKVDDPRDGSFAQCGCPICNASITVDHSQIPKLIWARLAYRKSDTGDWRD